MRKFNRMMVAALAAVNVVLGAGALDRVQTLNGRIDDLERRAPAAEAPVQAYMTRMQEPGARQEETERDMDVWAEAAACIAKTVYGEAMVCGTTERAAVVWCILNRADDAQDTTPEGVIRVVTKPHQFHGYTEGNPLLPELEELALDVIGRWLDEKDGKAEVGRVLPREYLFFSGDGKRNHFRTEWRGGRTWDWSLKSPYEEGGWNS